MKDDDRQQERDGWFTWPPTPKTQVVLIAIGIGLFNLLLILIWAIALYMTR
ncbi:MAG: hypothetical protein M3173_06200 [Chloroflexota bacterium]|nr:hypothetical protein [Chloroflexota bacterium]